jgi:hypothetical protein
VVTKGVIIKGVYCILTFYLTSKNCIKISKCGHFHTSLVIKNYTKPMLGINAIFKVDNQGTKKSKKSNFDVLL